MGELFDDAFRRRLEVLKRLVARALAGRGGSGRSALRERGGRLEFSGHRDYAPGDEPVAVDWNAYARLEHLVVKEFEAPREGHLLLVLDLSGSMQLLQKDVTVRRLAAAFAWLALATGARVACATRVGGGRWWTGLDRFPELLRHIEALPSGGAADLDEAVQRAPAAGVGPRSALVLSDLYEGDTAQRALSALRRRSASVAVLQVLAPEELRPPVAAAVELQDPETGKRRRYLLDASLRQKFVAAAASFLESSREICARHQCLWFRAEPGSDLLEVVQQVSVGVQGQ